MENLINHSESEMGDLRGKVQSIFEDRGRTELLLTDFKYAFRNKFGSDFYEEKGSFTLANFLNVKCGLSLLQTSNNVMVSCRNSMSGKHDSSSGTPNIENRQRNFYVPPAFCDFLRELLAKSYENRPHQRLLLVEEFVEIFNEYNESKNKKKFYCTMPHAEYFGLLPEVCCIKTDGGKDYILPNDLKVRENKPKIPMNSKFGIFLKDFLEKTYMKLPNTSAGLTVEEFIGIFNDNNRKNGKREFFSEVPASEYFKLHPDICRIVESGGENFIFPVDHVNPAQINRVGNDPSRDTHDEETHNERFTDSSQEAPEGTPLAVEGIQRTRGISISEAAASMSQFNSTLIGRSLTLEAYLKELGMSQPMVSICLERSRASAPKQLEFILTHTSGEATVSFVEGKLVFRKRSLTSSSIPIKSLGARYDFFLAIPHSSAFKTNSLALNEDMLIKPYWCNESGVKIQMNFYLAHERQQLLSLRLELRDFYSGRNMKLSPTQLYQGQPIAVPRTGVNDYHRAVITEVLGDRFATVYYVDLGTYGKVAIPSIQELDSSHMGSGIFIHEGRINCTSLQVDRVKLCKFLMEQEKILIKVRGFNSSKKYHKLELDENSLKGV